MPSNKRQQKINTERRTTTRPSKAQVKKEGKRVRVLSAPDSEKPKRPVKIHERPRWGGGGKQVKKVVKQSEKDPHYEKRRRQIEAQREKRQQELLEESEKFASNVPRGRSRYMGSQSAKERYV